MRVLVTGAFGYFGTALVRRLAREHQVVACGRPPRRRCGNEARAAIPSGVEEWEIVGGEPVAQFAWLARRSDVDAIVHLAGGGASGGDVDDAAAALHDNVLSAHEVMKNAHSGARLILASSIYVYGRGGEEPFREHDVCQPDTLYGAHKVVAESLFRQMGGLSLRFAHIYGAGSGVDFGRDGVTERLARWVVRGGEFTVRDGGSVVDLVHIDDACEAVARALVVERDRLSMSAINVGGSAHRAVTVQGLFSEFFTHVNEPGHHIVGYEGTYDPPRRLMDTAAAAYQDVLGWAPRVSLKDGVAGLVEMFRAQVRE